MSKTNHKPNGYIAKRKVYHESLKKYIAKIQQPNKDKK